LLNEQAFDLKMRKAKNDLDLVPFLMQLFDSIGNFPILIDDAHQGKTICQ